MVVYSRFGSLFCLIYWIFIYILYVIFSYINSALWNIIYSVSRFFNEIFIFSSICIQFLCSINCRKYFIEIIGHEFIFRNIHKIINPAASNISSSKVIRNIIWCIYCSYNRILWIFKTVINIILCSGWKLDCISYRKIILGIFISYNTFTAIFRKPSFLDS